MRTLTICRRIAQAKCYTAARYFSSATKPKHVGSEEQGKLLYRKLAFVGKNGSAKQVLNDVVMDGYSPRKYELVGCVKELRKYNQNQQAFEVFEWLERRKIQFGRYDHALYMDVIAKVKGVPAAEEYLENLLPPLKNAITYRCLLNIYCKESMADKAKLLFEKMDELRLINSAIPFNYLMALYLKTGNPEKVIELVHEMGAREIPCDRFTYTMRMQSYSALNDIESVEKVIEEITNNPNVETDWSIYSNLASIYLKAGIPKKAEAALRNLESQMPLKNREAYHFLMSSYATMMQPKEVRRLWNAMKSNFEIMSNNTYCALIAALSRLGDIEGLRECVEEWESLCSYYDVKVVNLAVKGFLKNDEYEEGERVFEKAVKRSTVPLYSARQMLCEYALSRNDVGTAMGHFERGISECKAAGLEWKPKKEIVRSFFEYFEKEKDVDGVHKFCEVLKGADLMDSDAALSLESVCKAAGDLGNCDVDAQ